MKFWYVESQKPTSDERSWVICMAEAGVQINDAALHFDFNKGTAYWIIHRFEQTSLAGLWQSSVDLKNNSTGGKFNSYHILTG